MHEFAVRLTGVPGVLGVLLGGSRARGTHTPAPTRCTWTPPWPRPPTWCWKPQTRAP
ncbi:hypothetical protein [Actinoplanes sp. TFC3]|uniref:hypothetical protein n=1 Tax=Actinoplanes sp. TFC3 TaxID=1710355 RepID=UPI000A80F3C1|nr:hypothetical protein [Actinoplanes sp. TFC3]